MKRSSLSTSKTDHLIVKMCLEGDSVAWEILVNRYRKLIFHFPSKAGLLPDQADEVFQDTCLALYRQLPHISKTENLAYWVGSVAQRITWKMIQTNRKVQHEDISEMYDVESPDLIPDENLMVKIHQHHIRLGMSSLDEKCRNLLLQLFFSDDSDYQQASRKLGISMGSIGPTRNRCLDKLKKLLKSQGLDLVNFSRIKYK